MADATVEEKIAAAKAALADRGVQDADEAERAVAVISALEALRPTAPPVDPEMIRKIVKEEIAALVPPESAESPVLVTTMLNSEDPAMKDRIKALGVEAQAIMKDLMASSGGSPSS